MDMHRPPFLDPTYKLVADYDFRSKIRTLKALYENFYTRYWFNGGSLDTLSGNSEKSVARDIHILEPDNGGLYLPLMLNGSLYGGTGSFWAGFIRSRRGFQPPFYVEARIKPPKIDQGVVSAVWCTPSSIDAKPEVDLVEIASGPNDTSWRSYHGLHQGWPDRADIGASGILAQRGSSGIFEPGYDYADRLSTFGCLIEPDFTSHYLNNLLLARRECPWRIQATGDIAPPANVIANIWTGGPWVSTPKSGNDLPCFMQVEFIRVWQPNGL